MVSHARPSYGHLTRSLRSHLTTSVVHVVSDEWAMNAWPVSRRTNCDTSQPQFSRHAESSRAFAAPGMMLEIQGVAVIGDKCSKDNPCAPR